MLGYVNSIRTVDGGTHIDGVKASLTRTLNNLGKKMKIFKVRRALAFCALFFFLGQMSLNISLSIFGCLYVPQITWSLTFSLTKTARKAVSFSLKSVHGWSWILTYSVQIL